MGLVGHSSSSLAHHVLSRERAIRAWVALLSLVLAALVVTACSGEGPEPRRTLDDARLRELELTREIPAQVGEACAQARRSASVRVLCPTLIPDVPLTRIEGLWGAMDYAEERRVYMLGFTSAGDFEGVTLKGVEHWIVGSGLAEVVEQYVLTDFVNEVEGNPVLVETRKVGGREVHIYQFPSYPAGGPKGDHVAAFVEVGDELVFASLHGKRYVEAAVEMALALADQAER